MGILRDIRNFFNTKRVPKTKNYMGEVVDVKNKEESKRKENEEKEAERSRKCNELFERFLKQGTKVENFSEDAKILREIDRRLTEENKQKIFDLFKDTNSEEFENFKEMSRCAFFTVGPKCTCGINLINDEKATVSKTNANDKRTTVFELIALMLEEQRKGICKERYSQRWLDQNGDNSEYEYSNGYSVLGGLSLVPTKELQNALIAKHGKDYQPDEKGVSEQNDATKILNFAMENLGEKEKVDFKERLNAINQGQVTQL